MTQKGEVYESIETGHRVTVTEGVEHEIPMDTDTVKVETEDGVWLEMTLDVLHTNYDRVKRIG